MHKQLDYFELPPIFLSTATYTELQYKNLFLPFSLDELIQYHTKGDIAVITLL